MQPTTLTQIIAAEQSRDRIAAAARSIALAVDTTASDASEPAPEVAIRRAGPADANALARLAQLDGRGEAFSRVVAGWADEAEVTVLIAEVEGAPVAALVVSTGTLLADPFEPSAALVGLLRVRAAQLRGAGRNGAHRSPVARLRSLVAG